MELVPTLLDLVLTLTRQINYNLLLIIQHQQATQGLEALVDLEIMRGIMLFLHTIQLKRLKLIE